MSLIQSQELIKLSYSNGEYVKGEWVKGKPKHTKFRGTAQPAPGKVMELLPEGKRNNETIIVYAPMNMEFTSADITKNTSGDIIIYDGGWYEVIAVKKWKAGLIHHWELVASRVEKDDRRTEEDQERDI